MRNGRRMRRGRDQKVGLGITLHDAYNGATRSAQISGKSKVCESCQGSGCKGNRMRHCKECDGQGQIQRPVQMGPMQVMMQQPCPRCGGEGRSCKRRCPACGGAKVVPDEKALTVNVAAGMADGQEIRFEGEGDAQPDVVPGDLIFVLQLDASGSQFVRDGNDLKTKEHISLAEGLLGFKHRIRHMDNRKIRLSHSGTTQPFEERRIEGEGMPVFQNKGYKGDLHVEYLIDFPDRISDDAKAKLIAAFK